MAGNKHASRAALAGDAAPPGPGEAIVMALSVSANQVEVRKGGGGGQRAQRLAVGAPHRFPTHPTTSTQIQRPDGTTGFVLLPARFHKRLWIKRGGFLVVTTPDPPTSGGLAGEVVAVLYARDVARMKGMAGVWPAAFAGAGEEAAVEAEAEAAAEAAVGNTLASDSDSSSGLPPLAANPNRRRPTYASSSDESE